MADSWLASEIASALTCNEIEALALLLAHHGQFEGAVRWLCEHLEHDDEGDLHGTSDGLKERLEYLGFAECAHFVDEFLGLAVPLDDTDPAAATDVEG